MSLQYWAVQAEESHVSYEGGSSFLLSTDEATAGAQRSVLGIEPATREGNCRVQKRANKIMKGLENKIYK